MDIEKIYRPSGPMTGVDPAICPMKDNEFGEPLSMPENPGDRTTYRCGREGCGLRVQIEIDREDGQTLRSIGGTCLNEDKLKAALGYRSRSDI